MRKQLNLWVPGLLLPLVLAGSASGQGIDGIGTRRSALAAFVAVADDASAVVWNPAGLVSGPIINFNIGLGRSTDTPDTTAASGSAANRFRSTLVAIGAPPLGLAYYRLDLTTFNAGSPSVGDVPDRQDGHVSVSRLVTHHVGATVLQSVGNYLTLGATLKAVRGTVKAASGLTGSWTDIRDRVDDEAGDSSLRGDLDFGAMLAAGRVRAGLVIRNVTAPTFGDEDAGARATLERHARVGVAWGYGWPGRSDTVVALDADVTRVAHAAGERRDLAAGVEQWLRGQQIGLRGGIRASTVGGARPVVSAGASYAVRSGLYVDGYIARGSQDARGWGLAGRVSY